MLCELWEKIWSTSRESMQNTQRNPSATRDMLWADSASHCITMPLGSWNLVQLNFIKIQKQSRLFTMLGKNPMGSMIILKWYSVYLLLLLAGCFWAHHSKSYPIISSSACLLSQHPWMFTVIFLFLSHPGSLSVSILYPVYALSLLCTCPNHLSLGSLNLSPYCSTWVVLLMPISNPFHPGHWQWKS